MFRSVTLVHATKRCSPCPHRQPENTAPLSAPHRPRRAARQRRHPDSARLASTPDVAAIQVGNHHFDRVASPNHAVNSPSARVSRPRRQSRHPRLRRDYDDGGDRPANPRDTSDVGRHEPLRPTRRPPRPPTKAPSRRATRVSPHQKWYWPRAVGLMGPTARGQVCGYY